MMLKRIDFVFKNRTIAFNRKQVFAVPFLLLSVLILAGCVFTVYHLERGEWTYSYQLNHVLSALSSVVIAFSVYFLVRYWVEIKKRYFNIFASAVCFFMFLVRINSLLNTFLFGTEEQFWSWFWSSVVISAVRQIIALAVVLFLYKPMEKIVRYFAADL